MGGSNGETNEKSLGQELESLTPVFSSRDSSKPFHSHAELQYEGMAHATVYKVYKRRFFGLIQLVLLNIVVSWDVCEIRYIYA